MQDSFARARTRPKGALGLCLYTRYPIVAHALGLEAAFRPSASREQRYLAYKAYAAARPSARATIGYLVYK